MTAQKNQDKVNTVEEMALLVANSDQKIITLWAADCAEHVLHFFKAEKPDDCRPAMAIEAANAWASSRMSVSEARKAAFAAHAAARESDTPAAVAAARSCGHAAATAHVIGHAMHAAAYAARSIEFSGGNPLKEYQWQLSILKEKYGEKLKKPE